MRKLLLFFLCFVGVTIVLPALIALPYAPGAPREREGEERRKDSKSIDLFVVETGETITLPLEEYIKGVVAAEMPASFGIEALKAQAVAARTYALNKAARENPPEHEDAPVCTDATHCLAWRPMEQALEGWGEAGEENWEKISAAVEDTKGQAAVFEDEPIVAVFHANSSGRTEDAAEVWGGSLPYLKSVESKGEELCENFISEREISFEQFREELTRAHFKAPQSMDEIGEPGYTEGGAVREIVIGDEKYTGTQIRSIFNLRSASFEIEKGDGSLTFRVKGNGHGVGMSQYGANYLASQGKTYVEILKTYYTGVEIAVY